jgi:Family of unknown function (DUF6232)
MYQDIHAGARQPAVRSRVFYDYDDVRVTSEALIIDDQRYQLAELRFLRGVRGPRSPLWVAAGIAAGVVAVLVALAARDLNSRGWIGAGVLLAVPLAALGLAALDRPRSRELWCDYRGRTVQILWTNDRYRYGQIHRALVRARAAQQ